MTITPSGTNLIIAWPAPSTGFLLQENSNPGTSNWVYSTYPTNVYGTQNQVTVTPLLNRRFYRLFQP
jgi:hypothetical protein